MFIILGILSITFSLCYFVFSLLGRQLSSLLVFIPLTIIWGIFLINIIANKQFNIIKTIFKTKSYLFVLIPLLICFMVSYIHLMFGISFFYKIGISADILFKLSCTLFCSLLIMLYGLIVRNNKQKN